MSIEAAVIFPLVIVIVAAFLVSYCTVIERAFFDYEDGVTFLLSVTESPISSLNDYNGRVSLESRPHFTGHMLSFRGRKREFTYFKSSKLIFSMIRGE